MQRLALVLVCGLTGCVDDPTQITVGVGSDDAPQSTDTPTQWPTALASPGSFSTVTVTNGASSLRVAPSGNTIWDFDALTVNATDNAQLRFFRHTVTSGEVSLLLQQGDGTANAAQVKLSGNRASYFRQPVGFGVTTPKYHIDVSAVNEKGRTTSNRLINVDTVNSTFDTTGGPLTSYGGYFNVHSGKSAGTGVLTNVAIYATATALSTAGYLTYAAFFDKGDVRINGHLIAGGTTPSVASCGTGATVVGDDKAGTITEGTGATGCRVTFATRYTAAPTCVVSSRAGLAFSTDAQATFLQVTNVGALAGTTLDYICDGH